VFERGDFVQYIGDFFPVRGFVGVVHGYDPDRGHPEQFELGEW
jgi:hypothetical protein